jgi:hypothetical protein
MISLELNFWMDEQPLVRDPFSGDEMQLLERTYFYFFFIA